ncbi:MAG TPA: glycoside hydrolase family 5 protein [Acidobacteriota bacterium]|nr:glycoside hydrolase family 5 protein [Acidobacteriota bacterium]
MKTLLSFLLLALLLPFTALTAQAPGQQETGVWWRAMAPGMWPYKKDAKKLPLISVKGNRFVDPEGNTILFRGLSISDPDKLASQGHWNRNHFVKVREMGAMVVRIPIHPVAWRGRTPAEYIKLLDQAVDWCTELDMYIMLDWHSIGNLTTGLFQDPMYETTLQETYSFWRIMARRYAGHNTVAFWELFNEPTTYRGQLGPVVWSEWKRICETAITIIRAYNPQAVVLVAGFDWAYDLTPIREAPINADNIAYVTHPYEFKRTPPWEPKWEEAFGFAAEKYPVIATEFGGATATSSDPARPAYGPAIIRYLESKGISWLVWCFDPEWGPTLISDWDYTLTPAGEFAKGIMTGEIKP